MRENTKWIQVSFIWPENNNNNNERKKTHYIIHLSRIAKANQRK